MLKFEKFNSFLLGAVLAVAPMTAQASWQCSAKCEYYSSKIQNDDQAFVEALNVDMNSGQEKVTAIGKYQELIRSTGDTQETAFNSLFGKCWDTASARSSSWDYDNLFQSDNYCARVLNPSSLEPATQENCSEVADTNTESASVFDKADPQL